MFDLSSLRQSAFGWNTALSLAHASKLAYERSATVESVTLTSWGFTLCSWLDAGDTQGFVAATDDVVLISFRGSESLGDWIGNLDIPMVDRTYGHVHRGFLTAFELVTEPILQALAANGTKDKRVWLTGHSLGGAIATVTAAELREQLAGASVHTFGQPRVGDQRLQGLFRDHYPDRFFRFVNDDDIVTRVPPGYSHVGRLVHFDSSGRVRQAASEADASQVEPPPLSLEQYEVLKREVERVRIELAAQGRPSSESALDRSIEGVIPGFSFADHRLERYIAAISRQAGATSVDAALAVESSSRGLQEALESTGGSKARRRTSDTMPVILRVTDEAWTPPPGIVVSARIGTILAAHGAIDDIERLASDPKVTGIEFSRDGGQREVLTSVPFVEADHIQAPPDDERGDSALIGIIDTGIDVMHEAFLDGHGNTRILAIWDQHDSAGPSPNAVDPVFTSKVGRLWLSSEIQQMVNSAMPVPTQLRDRDPDGHGTHVAGIAAGRAVGGLGCGMAPDARIVVVIPKMTTGPTDPLSIGYAHSHVQALEFLKRAAAGNSKVSPAAFPMAVNVSQGMNAGAHDGTSLLEASFDSITNKGREPGFVIVKSAGNERGHGGHARIQAFNGVMPVVWESDAKFRFQDYFEVWHDSLDELEFTLEDPAGNRSPIVSRANPSFNAKLGNVVVLGGNAVTFEFDPRCVDNGASRLVIQIFPKTANIQAGLWKLDINGVNVRSRTPMVDIWVERDDARAVRFNPEVAEVTLSIPGTADTVITVAACHAAAPLQLTTSSSFGPTRDGRAKPDVCAPGNNIVAARAGQANLRAGTVMTGTSMAAPHVTGALALALSHRAKQPNRPQHNAQQMRTALIRTTRFSSLHNPGPGHGMLDAKALFDDLK